MCIKKAAKLMSSGVIAKIAYKIIFGVIDMKKAIFIYNPVAGDHSIPGKLDYIIGRFQDQNVMVYPYRFSNFEENNLLSVLSQGAIDYVVISGGDGTLNYVINIMLKNNIKIPVGIIPSGTCNDFAYSLDIASSLEQCLDIILSGKTLSVDAGLINGTDYFLSTCAGGLFVDVSFNTHTELKKNFGPIAYYLKGLSEVKNRKPFMLKIRTEEETFEDEVLIFLILNGTRGAGFSNLIKEADVSDGIMDILVIKNCSHIDLAGLFFKVLSNDSLNDKNVAKLRTRSCVIECGCDIPVSVDGEKGTDLPLEVSFVNKALEVFVK